jgi:hypothetical protein
MASEPQQNKLCSAKRNENIFINKLNMFRTLFHSLRQQQLACKPTILRNPHYNEWFNKKDNNPLFVISRWIVCLWINLFYEHFLLDFFDIREQNHNCKSIIERINTNIIDE